MSQHASDSPQRNEDESADRDPVGEALPSASAGDRGAAPSHDKDDKEAADTSPTISPAPTTASGGIAATGSPDDEGETGPEPDQLADSPVRVGSPFAVDPLETDSVRAVEAFYDVGPLKYTAMGAVSASVMVVGFAAAAAYFFPAGGTTIAALGCVLSIFGMYSSYRLTAAGLLAIHLGLFVLSYSRMLGLE